MGDRFADQGKRGKMHDRLNLPVSQGGGQSCLIGQVANDEPPLRSRLKVAAAQVVIDPNLVAGLRQLAHAVRSDVTCTTRNENAHRDFSRLPMLPASAQKTAGVANRRWQRRQRIDTPTTGRGFLNLPAGAILTSPVGQSYGSHAPVRVADAKGMKPLKPKLLVPAAAAAAAGGSQGQRWVGACLDYMRTECHLAPNSLAAYKRDLARFCEWLGGRFVPKLTVRDLSDYMGWLQTKQLASASIARHMVALKLFYRYLQLEGIVKDNPAELLGTQKTWQRVPEVLSPGMVEKLLAAPQPRDAFWRRDRAMLELLYATGCRASEVSNLQTRDLHLSERYCLAHGKGSKDRLTPLGDAAIAAIEEYLKHERPKLAGAAKLRPPGCCSPAAASVCGARRFGNSSNAMLCGPA